MAYDLLIKNGRIIDGSGRPAFNGDVAVARGRIVELGRLDGAARRVIEADGRVVAPGFLQRREFLDLAALLLLLEQVPRQLEHIHSHVLDPHERYMVPEA
jgi:N-acyl-D-aspartate/D-glutamate deacylase